MTKMASSSGVRHPSSKYTAITWKSFSKAPATVTVSLTVSKRRAGHVTTWNAWDLADAQGTVGKRSASSLEGRTKDVQDTKGKTLSPPPPAGPSGDTTGGTRQVKSAHDGRRRAPPAAHNRYPGAFAAPTRPPRSTHSSAGSFTESMLGRHQQQAIRAAIARHHPTINCMPLPSGA